MSHNILNNSNYFKYVKENFEKFKSSSDKYNVNEYFDIFRMKWNRIIIDEIHELVYNFGDMWARNASNTKQNRIITYNIMFNLNSNYRWGLSATPLIKSYSNLSGYLCFLSDTFKSEFFRKANNIKEIDFYNFLYKKEEDVEEDSEYGYYRNKNNNIPIMHLIDENNLFYSNCLDTIKLFTDNEFEKIQKQIFIKTSKNLVKSEIKIPIFTEEIKYIDLSNIERNIYNNAKSDSSYTYYYRYEKIKRLFQLCTNICISDKDLLNMGFDANKVISLEELNKGMIDSFKKHLNKNTKALKDNEFKLNNLNLIKSNGNEILNYINNSLNITSMYNKSDLRDLDNILKISFFNNTSSYNRYRYYYDNEHNNVESIEQKRYIRSIYTYLNKYLHEITISDLFNSIYYFNNVYFTKLHNLNKDNKDFEKSIRDVAIINVVKDEVINKPKDNSQDKPKDNSQDKPKDNSENKPKDTSQDKPKDTSENKPKDTSEIKNTIKNTNTLNVQNIKTSEDTTLKVENSEDTKPKVENSEDTTLKVENSEDTKDDENKLTISSMFSDNDVFYIITKLIVKLVSGLDNDKKNMETDNKVLKQNVIRYSNQIKLFENNDFLKEETAEPCSICWCDFDEDTNITMTDCRHIFCRECFLTIASNKSNFSCPTCRQTVHTNRCKTIKMREIMGIKEPEKKPEPKEEVPDWKTTCIQKYGSKMASLIEYLKQLFDDKENNNRVILFSQYDNMLKLIGKTFDEFKIKNVHCKGNVHVVNKNIDNFKRDESIRVIMLSSEQCNSGSNLTEASHVILVDVLNMDKSKSMDVEAQAIGRAVRLGQKKPVKIVRFITRNTIEEETYNKNKYDIKNIQ